MSYVITLIITFNLICAIIDFNCILIIFRLKSIDLVCMKKLDTKVNVIPIIAKADTISKSELQKFKVNDSL
jgi:hypothetical protein